MNCFLSPFHSAVRTTIDLFSDFTKTVAVFTAACFLSTTVLCPAAHAVIAGIPAERPPFVQHDNLIPYTAGRITEAKYYGSDTVVINIQDLHCHGEVQKNIARILESLDRAYGLSEVHVEGGIGKIDTSWASLVPERQRRERMLNILLDSGKLSGAEYYAIRSGKNDLLAGLEAEKPYRENLARLREITAYRGRNAALLPDIRQHIAPLKEQYFSPRNRRLEKLIAKGDEGEEYYRSLVRYAHKAGIDLYEYPEITDYLSAVRQQKRLNHKRVARELSACLSSLKTLLPYSVYQELSSKTENFSRTDDLCVQLLLLTQKRSIPVADKYPSLGKYFTLIETMRRINPLELVREERQLVRELRDASAANRAEKEVVFMADYEDYLKDYFDGKIAADNYRYFTANTDRFISLWKKYVSTRDLPNIEPENGLLRDFYRVNIDRNSYFLQNLFSSAVPLYGGAEYPDIDHRQKVLESLGSTHLATVVTGGFHTPGFLALLREKKISYLVITPSVTSDTSFSDKAYDRLAREQGETIPTQTIALASYSQELLRWQDAQKQKNLAAENEALARLKIAKDTLEGELQLALQETGDPVTAAAEVNRLSKELGFDAKLTSRQSDASRRDKYLFDYVYKDNGRSVELELTLDRTEGNSPGKRLEISHLLTAALSLLFPAVVLSYLFLHGYLPAHFEPLTIAQLQAPFISLAMMVSRKPGHVYPEKERLAALDSLLRQIQHPDEDFLQRLDDLIDIGMITRKEKAVLRTEIAAHPTEYNYRTVFAALKRLGASDAKLKEVAFNLLKLDSQGAKVTGLRFLDGRKIADARMIKAAKELLRDPFSNFRVAGIITLERIGTAEDDVVNLIVEQLNDPEMYPAVFSAVLTLDDRGFSLTAEQQLLLADAVLDVLTPFVYADKPWRTNNERDLITAVLPLTGMQKDDQRLINAYALFATAPELSQDEDAQKRAVDALKSTHSAAATGPLLQFMSSGQPYTVVNNSFYALSRIDRRNMPKYRMIALNALGNSKSDLAREMAATEKDDARHAVLENKIRFIEKLMTGISNFRQDIFPKIDSPSSPPSSAAPAAPKDGRHDRKVAGKKNEPHAGPENAGDPQKILERVRTMAETGTERDLPWLVRQLEQTQIDALPYPEQPEYISTIFWALTKIKYRGAAVHDDPLISQATLRLAERDTYSALSDQQRFFIEGLMTPGMMTGELIAAFAAFNVLPGNRNARDIQMKAVHLLGLSGSPDAIAPLKAYLTPTNNVAVIYEAYLALIKLAPGSSGKYLQDAAGVFNSSTEYRKQAVNMFNARITSIDAKLKADAGNAAQLLKDRKRLEDFLKVLKSRPIEAAIDQISEKDVQELIGRLKTSKIAAINAAEQPKYIDSIFWSLSKLKKKGIAIPDDPLIAGAAMLMAERYPALTNGQRASLHEILTPRLMSWELINALDASFEHDLYRDNVDLQISFIRLLGKSGSTHAAEPLKKFFTRRNRVSIIYETYRALEQAAPASASLYFDRTVEQLKAGDNYRRNAINMFIAKSSSINEKLKKSGNQAGNDREELLKELRLLEAFLEALRYRQPADRVSSARTTEKFVFKTLGVLFLSTGFAALFMIRLAMGQPESVSSMQTNLLASLPPGVAGFFAMMPFFSLAMAKKLKKKNKVNIRKPQMQPATPGEKEETFENGLDELLYRMPTGDTAFYEKVFDRLANEELTPDERNALLDGLAENIAPTNYSSVFSILDHSGDADRRIKAAFKLLESGAPEALFAALDELYRLRIDDQRLRTAEAVLLSQDNNTQYIKAFADLGKQGLLSQDARSNIVHVIAGNLNMSNYDILFDRNGREGIATALGATPSEKAELLTNLIKLKLHGAKDIALIELELISRPGNEEPLHFDEQDLETIQAGILSLLKTGRFETVLNILARLGNEKAVGPLLSLLDDETYIEPILSTLIKMHKRGVTVKSDPRIITAMNHYEGYFLNEQQYWMLFDLLQFTAHPDILADNQSLSDPILKLVQRTDPDKAADVLLRVLASGNPNNKHIITALGRLGYQRSFSAGGREAAIQGILKAFSQYNASAALPALEKLGAPPEVIVPRATEMLELAEEKPLAAVLRYFENNLDTLSADEDLRKKVQKAALLLRHSTNAEYRKDSLALIETAGDKEVVIPLLEDLLERSESRVRLLIALERLINRGVISRIDKQTLTAFSLALPGAVDTSSYKDILRLMDKLLILDRYKVNVYARMAELPDEQAQLAAIKRGRLITDIGTVREFLKTFLAADSDYSADVITSAYNALMTRDMNKQNREEYTADYNRLIPKFSLTKAEMEALSAADLRKLANGTLAATIGQQLPKTKIAAAPKDLHGKMYLRFVYDLEDSGVNDDISAMSDENLHTYIVAPLLTSSPDDAGVNLTDDQAPGYRGFSRVALPSEQGEEQFLNIRARKLSNGQHPVWLLRYAPLDPATTVDEAFAARASLAVAKWMSDNPHAMDNGLSLQKFLGAGSRRISIDLIEADQRLYADDAALDAALAAYPRIFDETLFFQSGDRNAFPVEGPERPAHDYMRAAIESAISVSVALLVDPQLMVRFWTDFDQELPSPLQDALVKHAQSSGHITLGIFNIRTDTDKEPAEIIEEIETAVRNFIFRNPPPADFTAHGMTLMGGTVAAQLFPGPAFTLISSFVRGLQKDLENKGYIEKDPSLSVPHIGFVRIFKNLTAPQGRQLYSHMLPLRSKDWGEQTAQRLEISYREGFKPPQRFSVFDLKPAPGQEDAQDSIAWDAVDTSELDIPRQEWEQRFGDIWDESMGSIVNNGFVSNKPDSDTVYVSLVIDPYLMRTLQRTLEDKLPANIREKIRWNQSSRFNLNEFWVKPGNGQAVKKAIENLRFENLPDAPVFRMGTPRLHNKALMVPVRFSAGADAVQDELVSPVEAALADRVNPSRNFTGGLFLGYLDDNEKLSSEEYTELQLILERLFEGDWGRSTAVSLKVRGKIGGNIAVQKKFELKQGTPAASPVRRLFAATFMYETLTEKLSLMAQAVRAKKISVLSRKKPILAETIDLPSFNGGMVRLAGTDRNYFKEQALKGTDTFVLSGLSAVLKDKAGMKYLPQVIANAKAANVRIVFDHDITADEIRNGQLKDNVQQMLAHGFDGYRLRYDGDEPAGLASQLSGLLRDTYISNAAAVVALPYNGTPFGKELEALATEYNLYRLALFDPKDQQRKLQADRLPENAWVEMVPREYVNDTAGAEAFKNDLKYLMGLPGARVIGIDSGIISQGEHRIFSGISDFVDYFAGLFAARVAQLRKTPDFRYESGRANALNIADKDVPSFGDEQAALLNLLNDQRSLAGKAENERAPLMDRMLLNLSVVLLSNRTGDSLNRLEKLYKEAAAETNDTEKELIIAEIAGFIRGLLEKDAVRHLLLVRNKAFASPKYAEMYGWGVVEARLQMERTPEGKKIEEKKINEKIDDNYERFHAPLKDYAKSAVFELSMNDLKQTSNELARIKELGDYLDDLETRGTPAELGKESVSRISELYFYVQHGKPGTRPVALAELLKVLELYADKQSSFDPAKLKDTSKKMIYDVIGIKAVESAA